MKMFVNLYSFNIDCNKIISYMSFAQHCDSVVKLK